MKKIIYSLMGITALAFALSCEKEQELPKEEAKTVAGNENPEVLPANIPAAITASLVDTKTSYDGTGAFSWTTGEDGDHIYLMFYKEDTHYQGWVEYKATSADANGKAVFTIVSNQGDRISALADYTNSGVAVYGAGRDNHVARPYTDNNEACTLYKPDGEHTVSYDPFLTLRQSLAGASSEVVLLGTGVGDTDSNTGVFTDYHFYTACAVLKVTVSGIPNNAKELRLCTADNVNYPLHGDFAITYIRAAEKPIAPELTKDSYRQYKSSGSYWDSSSSYVAAACDGSSTTQTFYFNVPTGEYPANTLSIQLVDNNDNELLKKTITANYTFNRNDLVPASFDNEWVTLGVGKYADYWMQGFLNKVEDMWDVTIQKSTTGRTYRITNPYSKGSDLKQTGSHGAYLSFSIDANAEGTETNSGISFVDHLTGVFSGTHNLELHYISSSTNKVIQGTADDPEIVQLAPEYRDTDSWKYPRSNRNNMIRIVLPNYVSSLTESMTFSSTSTDCCSFTRTAASAAKVYVGLSTKSYMKMIYDKGNNDFGASITSDAAIYWEDPETLSFTNSYDELTSASFTSGPLYVIWYTTNDNGTVLTFGSKKMCFLTTDHSTSYMHQYSMTYTEPTPVSPVTLTLEVSDDSTKGNVMLTEFNGVTGKLYGVFTGPGSSTNLIFTNAKTTPFANNHFIYSNNNSDLDDLNLSIGYDTSKSSDYDNKNWNLISFNRYLMDKIGNTTISYKFLRGNPVE